MNDSVLETKESFSLPAITLHHNLSWHKHLSALDFSFDLVNPFFHSNLYTIYVFQVRPNLKYCPHIMGAAPPSTLHVVDAVQKKVVKLIDGPVQSFRYPCLARRLAGSKLSSFIDFSMPYALKNYTLKFHLSQYSVDEQMSSWLVPSFTVQSEKPRFQVGLNMFKGLWILFER